RFMPGRIVDRERVPVRRASPHRSLERLVLKLSRPDLRLSCRRSPRPCSAEGGKDHLPLARVDRPEAIHEPSWHHVHVMQALGQGSEEYSAIASGCLERKTSLWRDYRLKVMRRLVCGFIRLEPTEELELSQQLAGDTSTLLGD